MQTRVFLGVTDKVIRFRGRVGLAAHRGLGVLAFCFWVESGFRL